MPDLTQAQRDLLLAPCDCGHTINDHGGLVECWRCEDEGDECAVTFEAILSERIARMVAEAEQRALREAIEDHAETFGVACSTSRAWLRDRLERLGTAP